MFRSALKQVTLGCNADMFAAQPGASHDSAQREAVVGAYRIPVQQLPYVDGEGGLRGEDHEVSLCGIDSIEHYGLELARHFVRDIEPVDGARIEIEEFAWERAVVDGVPHDHTWMRAGRETRTAAVTVDATGEYVIGGFKDLVILKSTGSEFAGFLKDEYTTLQETKDRVMATSLVAKWRFASSDVDWNAGPCNRSRSSRPSGTWERPSSNKSPPSWRFD